jgi:hypothetical protein
MTQVKLDDVELPGELLDLLGRSRLSTRDRAGQIRTALAIHLFIVYTSLRPFWTNGRREALALRKRRPPPKGCRQAGFRFGRSMLRYDTALANLGAGQSIAGS